MEHSAQPQLLRRSNAITARLRREHLDPLSNDHWTAGNAKLSKAVKYARKQDQKAEKRQEKKLEKASRQNSFQPSIPDNACADMVFQALPMGPDAATSVTKTSSIAWSRSGALGSPAGKGPSDTKTKRWAIFGRKKEDSQRPVDNYAKWNGSDRERRPYAASGSAGLMDDAVLGVASPSKDIATAIRHSEHTADLQRQRPSTEQHSPSDESLVEAILDNARLQDQLAQAVEPDQLHVARTIIDHLWRKREGRYIDWSQTSAEQVQEFFQQLEEDRRNDASPTDSGIEMGKDEPPMDKGKGRALSVSSNASHYSIVVHGGKLVAAEALRHSEELEHRRKHSLAEALEMEYQRMKQEEEDAKRARQLQEEERLEQERQEEEERIAAELASRRDCIVCGDEKHVLDFPAKPATEKCEHPPKICTDCMHTWLASELASKGCESLKCPECPCILSYPSIQTLADEPTFTKYEHLLLRNTLSSLPDFAWCLSPTCTAGQLNTANGNYMQCDTTLGGCGYKQCLLHQTPWHRGETCTQFSHRITTREEEAATEAILDEVSKKCPGQGCGWRIQKVDGCDHMTCRKCRWQFCWECLASHREIRREGNTAHQRWCKFHSENLDGVVGVSWPFNAHA